MPKKLAEVETAREHIRNALQVLEISGLDDEDEDGQATVVFLEDDLDGIVERLERALAELDRGNA